MVADDRRVTELGLWFGRVAGVAVETTLVAGAVASTLEHVLSVLFTDCFVISSAVVAEQQKSR